MPKKQKAPKDSEEVILPIDNEEEFSEPEEHEAAAEDIEADMNIGEKEADMYTEEGREQAREADETADWEEGFEEGAAQGGQEGVCALCGKPLSLDKKKNFIREISHKRVAFCNVDHAMKYEEKKAKKKSK